jgi:hypothetical protein
MQMRAVVVREYGTAPVPFRRPRLSPVLGMDGVARRMEAKIIVKPSETAHL